MSVINNNSSNPSSSVPLSSEKTALKICVLQPDYSTSDVDYQHYDPPRDLSHLIPEANFTHVLLNKLTTYKQLKALKKEKFDVFVNLCEGYLEWSVPSIDVIHSLELLQLPYTGPTALLYDPPKVLMKYVAYTEGIQTASYALIQEEDDVEQACKKLQYPLFVKPAKAGDSLGIDAHSRVNNINELKQKVKSIINEYEPLLVEEYIEGREFTVMLAANDDGKTARVFTPVEYIFPKGTPFKTYALKTSALHPYANIAVTDVSIAGKLKEVAAAIFKSFNGVGYARLDFRMDANGILYFLEINFTCSVFYTNGYEGSADYILKHDGYGQANFLRHIIAEGIARHGRKQNKYTMKGNAIAGYGIYANTNIAANEVIFKGEEMAQRMVTRRYIAQYWNDKEKEVFRKYAYPLSKEVFLLWDNDPSEWAPQNHSCDANTAYEGLNVIALKNIAIGEELTLNYSSFLDENMEPFNCHCGSILCKGFITGIKNTSVTEKESKEQTQLTNVPSR